MEKKIVVIGPSKVGKTALVASLAQAGGQMGLQLRSEEVADAPAPAFPSSPHGDRSTLGGLGPYF